MTSKQQHRVVIGLCLGLQGFGAVGFANVVGVDTQNFNPTTSGLDFVTVQSSETLNTCVVNIGLFANQARNSLPLFNRVEDENSKNTSHSDTVTGADINVGLGLGEKWDIGLSLPQVLAQSVAIDVPHGEFDAKGNTELRFNTKYRFWGDLKKGVAAVGTVSLNRLRNNPYVGNGAGPTQTLELVADTTIKQIALGLNLGYRLRRPGTPLADFPVEPFRDQYTYSAAASYHFPAVRTKVILEFYGSSPKDKVRPLFDRSQTSAEILLGVKTDLTSHVAGHIGGGREGSRSISSPSARMYTGLNVALGPFCESGKKFSLPVRAKAKVTPKVAPKPVPATEIKDREDIAALPSQESLILENIYFLTDKSDQVLPGAKVELQKLADYLLTPPVFKSLIVEGHTDYMGSDEYNRKLSQERADTIRRYLIEVHHLDAMRIKAIGYGEDRPIADNGNYQGRQKNRRVEFKIER